MDPEWAERVEREAIRMTASAQVAYEAAQRRLQRAEERLTRVIDTAYSATRTRALARAEALVELRRTELIALSRLMTSVPASATHRGTSGYRNIPSASAL